MAVIDHLTIQVNDYRQSRDWYVGHIGLREHFEIADRAVALEDEAGFEIFLEQSERPVIDPPTILYFKIDNVDARHEKLAAAGVAFVHPPRKEYWGYGAELKDPSGYRVRLWDEVTMREKV